MRGITPCGLNPAAIASSGLVRKRWRRSGFPWDPWYGVHTGIEVGRIRRAIRTLGRKHQQLEEVFLNATRGEAGRPRSKRKAVFDPFAHPHSGVATRAFQSREHDAALGHHPTLVEHGAVGESADPSRSSDRESLR